MTKIFLKSVLGLLLLLVILFVIWYSNVGRKNLYYIEEMNMYIKTFPSRESAIIAFSDKKIGKFADSLNYVKINKGVDYYTYFFFDVKDKTVIYSRNNSIKNTHLIEYKIETVQSCDTTYYKREGSYCFLKPPYIGISIDLYGSTERLSLKNKNDVDWTEIKPIK